MSLDQSGAMLDRALVTLCAELPEALGLYNTARDQFTISALRSVPMLEKVRPESAKYSILRDWMRAYEPKEDQPLSSEISLDSLHLQIKRERKEAARLAREQNADLMPSENGSNISANAASTSSSSKAERKKQRKQQKEVADRSSSKAKGKQERRKKVVKAAVSTGKKRRAPVVDLAGDDDDEEDEASTAASSSGSSSSDEEDSGESDSDEDSKKKRRGKDAKQKKKNPKSNLPPVEEVLSSDVDEEPNDLFDPEDPDVYEVETILDKRKGRNYGEPDKYLIKWEGYEETTWEPAANVPKHLIDEYEAAHLRDDEFIVEHILDRKSTRDKQTKLKDYKYFVKWVGYEDATWEPSSNLPHNLRRKFDQQFEAKKRKLR